MTGATDQEPACRLCGCTQLHGCPEGCWWVDDPLDLGPLCSSCETLAQVMRLGPFQAGEILVAPYDLFAADPDALERQLESVRTHFDALGSPAPLFLLLDDPADVQHLTLDEIARLGWVPAAATS